MLLRHYIQKIPDYNWKTALCLMKIYWDLCCRVYSQRAMAPLTWTLRDLTTPNCGISMQASKICIISTGIPSFSRPRTRTWKNDEMTRTINIQRIEWNFQFYNKLNGSTSTNVKLKLENWKGEEKKLAKFTPFSSWPTEPK